MKQKACPCRSVLIRGSRFLLLTLLVVACTISEPVVRKPRRKYFEDLVYAAAAAEYRTTMEKKFETRDNSYVLTVLTYAVTSFYGRDRENARRAFTAAYKVDDGSLPEAAKFYEWLQVDARKVYRLAKRERELIHLYLGLNYFVEDNLEESLVEFKKLRLRDQEVSTLPLVNFYMGLVYEKLGMYGDALIEYRGLRDMGFPGRHSLLDADALVRRAEQLRDGTYEPDSSRVELLVHVDHQFAGSVGRTDVLADGQPVATLPGYVDEFEVKLTAEEVARKETQNAGAQATRAGLRLLAELLGTHFLEDTSGGVADLVTDLVFGDEDDNRDTRSWSYAPVAMSAVRVSIPVTTNELKLVFHGRAGELLGSCRYPLTGEHIRVERAAGMRFVAAGLAREFYVYE